MPTPNRQAIALQIAAESDNPTVQDALQRLLIAVELAHGEEIAMRQRRQAEKTRSMWKSAGFDPERWDTDGFFRV